MSHLPDPSSLANILADVAANKPLALAQLYRAVAGRLYAIALGIAKQDSLAETVLERSFISLWQGEDRDPGAGPTPLAWLGRLVRARALASLGHASLSSNNQAPTALLKAKWCERLSLSPSQHPVSRLPEQQRRTLLLAYGLALPYAALAEDLETDLIATQSNLRHALLSLAQDHYRNKAEGGSVKPDRDRLALDILIAEHVLRVTQETVRTQLARLIATDKLLQTIVDRWQERLAPLIELAPDIQPPLAVWDRIQRATVERLPQTVFSSASPSAKSPEPKASGLCSSLAFWRWLTAFSSALAIGCAGLFLFFYQNQARAPLPHEPGIGKKLAVLVDRERIASWFMRTDDKGRSLTINPLRHLPPLDNKRYVLWLIVDGNHMPIDLGAIPDFGQVIAPLPKNFAKASYIGITLEPIEEEEASRQSTLLSEMSFLGAIVPLEAPAPP